MPHRYAHVGIEPLSQVQARKLVSGGRVRVKLGTHHKIHVSHEHHKKLHKAHQKGAGVMIELDPYACELNEHLLGEGIGKHLKHAAHKVGHFVKHHKEQFRPLASALREAGHQGIADASMYALEQGVDPSLVGAYGSMAHEAIHPQMGGKIHSVGQFFKTPALRTVRKALRPIGQMALNDALALGEQGLSQGMSQASSGMSSGMGFLGMGIHKRVPVKRAPARKAPAKIKRGSALFPAGMY